MPPLRFSEAALPFTSHSTQLKHTRAANSTQSGYQQGLLCLLSSATMSDIYIDPRHSQSPLDQAEYDCTAGSSLRSICKQAVPSVNNKNLTDSFNPGVGNLQSVIIQIIVQVRSLFLQVCKCFTQGKLWRRCSGLCLCKFRI